MNCTNKKTKQITINFICGIKLVQILIYKKRQHFPLKIRNCTKYKNKTSFAN